MGTKTYKGVVWDTDDLISCKQAFKVLFYKGVSIDELLTLDFGGLWIEDVLNDLQSK